MEVDGAGWRWVHGLVIPVLIIVCSFEILTSRGTLIILFLQLAFYSELSLATKILCAKNSSTDFLKVSI